jgi:hypothetical protein
MKRPLLLVFFNTIYPRKCCVTRQTTVLPGLHYDIHVECQLFLLGCYAAMAARKQGMVLVLLISSEWFECSIVIPLVSCGDVYREEGDW